MLFGQAYDPTDLAKIGALIVLEGVLSVDNAMVLGLLARRVPKHQQTKALTYGLVGALVFRLIAIAMASLLIKFRWVALVGGAYLIYISVKHFFFETAKEEAEEAAASLAPSPRSPLKVAAGFWPTVLVIELTDIAFAVDSILAAVGLVGPKPDKIWVIYTGGVLGVVLMRFAAAVFIRLLERFPRMEIAAYLLVILIGLKLCLEFFFNPDPQHPNLHFDSLHTPEGMIFWGIMLLSFLVGFTGGKGSKEPPVPEALQSDPDGSPDADDGPSHAIRPGPTNPPTG